ncbi:MAG: TonB-dependent receptor [Chitinophagales bacterium]|nr:TonB-dependent receptor [Chitinophagales bacterium]
MVNVIVAFLLSLSIVPVYSQTLVGFVFAEGKPLPFASVQIKGTSIGTVTDDKGFFVIHDLNQGDYQLLISAIGYQMRSETVHIDTEKLDLGILDLAVSTLGLDEVVVTGTMKNAYIGESPVKVEVITAAFIEKTASNNVVEAINYVNGITEVVGCGVCFTNSISINGMDGPYTAVLIDGTPMFGNLASVYGLNGIPNSMVERIEIIKGPSSTLYGSEAIAGVINVITKKPEKQPHLSIDQSFTSHLESYTDVAYSPSLKRWKGIISANYAYVNHYDDRQEDGFADQPSMDRLSVFSKWSNVKATGKRFDISGKFFYEDRRNGVKDFLSNRAYRSIRGNDSIYGESIYTLRGELFGTWELPVKPDLRLDYSFSAHHQDSYYGNTPYLAKQYIGYLNLLWNRRFGKHQLTTGATGRAQWYDDNTIVTTENGRNAGVMQHIPGIFIQDECFISEQWDLLAGLRLDYYSAHGVIPAPRVCIKYMPAKMSTLRFNFGTGFRIVNLFTEDHAFVSGNRNVVIEEDLKPERSWNGTLNLNQRFTIGKSQGFIDVDGFYTWFSNAINPDYSIPGQIIYGNSDGHIVNTGAAVSINQEFYFPISYSIGFTYLHASNRFRNNAGETVSEQLPFAASWSGVATVSYRWKKAKLTIDYTANLKGPMRLPEVYDWVDGGLSSSPRAYHSPVFSIQNIQVSKDFEIGIRLYGGVRNLFDYVQPQSPLAAYNDPNFQPGFSPYFDTSYAYAVQHGREFFLGVRYQLKKS